MTYAIIVFACLFYLWGRFMESSNEFWRKAAIEAKQMECRPHKWEIVNKQLICKNCQLKFTKD